MTRVPPESLPAPITISGEAMMLMQAVAALRPGQSVTIRIWPDGIVSFVTELYDDPNIKPTYFNERPELLSDSLIRLLKDMLTNMSEEEN